MLELQILRGTHFKAIVQGHLRPLRILANFQISERGTNERKKFKKRNIPKFPIHYYTKIAAKTGTHDKIILFFASKRGTVPPKEEHLASMHYVLKNALKYRAPRPR